jgi:uncharacterized OB-fold protein
MGSAMDIDTAESPRDAYWRMLEEGRFRFQRCASCGHAWLPPREDCPSCWSSQWRWEEARGRGKLVSWVVFHTAFDEAFELRVPYNVAVVELDEGPRLITNIVNLPGADEDPTDRPVSLTIEADHGRSLPRFKLA